MADTESGNYLLAATETPVAVRGRWFKAASVLLLGTAGLVLAFSAAKPSNSAHLLPSVQLDSRGPPMVHFKDLVTMQLPATQGQVNGAFFKVPGKSMSVGLYRLSAGNSVSYTYRYPEFKYIVEGEWDLTDETGQVVHATAGDLMYFPMGTTVNFTVAKTGLGYYIADATTRHDLAEALATATPLNPSMVHFPQIAKNTNLPLIENPAGSLFFQKDLAFDSTVPALPSLGGGGGLLEMTAGLCRNDAGPAWTTTYDNEEFALVTEGEFHLVDGTGQHITAKAGDMVYFPQGTQLSSTASDFGLALVADLRYTQ